MSGPPELRSSEERGRRGGIRPAASATSSDDLEPLLEATVRTLSELVGSRTAFIALRDEDLWEVVAAVDRAGIGLLRGVRAEPGMAAWTSVLEQALGLGVADEDGQLRPSQFRTVEVAPITLADGEIVGAVGVMDLRRVVIADSHRVVMELIAAFLGHAYDDVWRQRELEAQHDLDVKQAEDRRQLLSEVVHDFRTPLSVISGMADLLQRHRSEPTQIDVGARAISANAKRLSTMVDGLLEAESTRDLASAEGAVQIDLRDLVTDIAADTRQLVSRSNVGVTFYGGGQLRAPIVLVRRLLLNLTANAVKHTRDGRISIGAEQVDGGALFTVSDTGSGMSDSDIERFADAYVKGERSEGFGLGLSIVHRLAEVVGASVEADGQPGYGTTFRVFVPDARS